MNRSSIAAVSNLLLFVVVAACGPSARNGGTNDGGGSDESCNPGDSRACYDGQTGTEGVGPCVGGTQTCAAGGTWGTCVGEVVPVGEICGDNIDNNCNGMVDEDVDADGDGFTTCGGDCCDSTECSDPKAVNPGAYDVPGDGVDNDCDGIIDNAPTECGSGAAGQSTTGSDYARAMDICQITTATKKTWGLIDATFGQTSGTTLPNKEQHAILTKYGTGVTPHNGTNLALFSTGIAAGEGDPDFDAALSTSFGKNNTAAFPADWYTANNSKLPNAPGCPAPTGAKAGDPIMLTMHIRVPTNASSFSLDINFFSSEFPEYTCSPFNDFFVILLDSTYAGTPANPTDKNLAFYKSAAGSIYPVGINLASGNTGLFTQCVKGATGCAVDPIDSSQSAVPGTITTCTGTDQLAGTGLEAADPEQTELGEWAGGGCAANSEIGGATGWLTTTGNVTPGEIMTLRIAIWDTSDTFLDSSVVLDNFKWSAQPSNPGTIIQ